MSIKELSAPKGDDAYIWMTYSGAKPTTLTTKAGKSYSLTKGSKWGYRASSNGKVMRVIVQDLGPTFVFTYTVDQVSKLQAKSTQAKGGNALAPKIKTKIEVDTPESTDGTLLRQVKAFWDLFQKYRHKFVPSTPSHLAIFEWGRDFSGIIPKGTKKLYRGTRLRGEDFKVGANLTLTHARDLISFSASVTQANQFALRRNGVGARIKGLSYVLESEVLLAKVLVSPPILLGIGKKLRSLERKTPTIFGKEVDLDEGWGQTFIDEAKDLVSHENEYFVLSDNLKVKVKTKLLDGAKV